jgi:nitroreductase
MADVNPALSLLLTRRSCSALSAPAPSEEEQWLILQAALRVPDFQRLRPFRFLIARGTGLDRLGEMMHRSAIAAGKPGDVTQRTLRMPHRAPLVITVVSTPKANPVVPPLDQILAAGCTVMAMQMAACALGYGGVWRSGWLMHDRHFHRELGLGDDDQIVGFLYVGTPSRDPAPLTEEDPEPFVQRL